MIIRTVLIILLSYLFYTNYFKMSDNSNKPTQAEKDAEYFNPDNLTINIGGRSVPFTDINKPHHAVIQPRDHHANIEAMDFPDIEPEAKEREAKLAEARKKE